MLSTFLQPRPPSGAVSKVLDELDAYLKEPLVTNEAGEFDLSFSPIQYWKMNEHRFPKKKQNQCNRFSYSTLHLKKIPSSFS